MDKADKKSRRIRERVALTIPVRVSGSDGSSVWSEKSRLKDLTPFGARLSLKRPTEIGRLLHIIGAIPQSMRCFDSTEDQYRVWSLVRNLKLLEPGADALLEIGVAFVGKQPPKSLESDPARLYEIAPSRAENGLWIVAEESDQVIAEVMGSDKRKESRHAIPIDLLIEVYGANGEISQSENTVTENISRQGAAVFTTLEAPPGRFVKISSVQSATARLAAVRNYRFGPDGIPRLHLEFIGGDWPL
jgi:hypothetical protein